MKFSIKDFFSTCDQIRRKLRIWLRLLNKSLMETSFFCAVFVDGSWGIKVFLEAQLISFSITMIRVLFKTTSFITTTECCRC